MNILQKIYQQRLLQLQEEKKQWQVPSFSKSIEQKSVSIIGEIKRASPSEGDIASNDFDLLDQAQWYLQKGVQAFSILTEQQYFKGDNRFLVQVQKEFSQVPILRKDFIFSAFQVAHAKFLHASAILLIVAMLDDEQLHNLHSLALQLDLEVLVEVHNQEELQRALQIPHLKILGINNRNLKSFEVDLQTSKYLIEKIPSSKKEQLILVSESGYKNKKDLQFAHECGFDAVLVGSSLMKGDFFEANEN